MSRLSVVLGVLLLLGTVGVVFREMDRSRDKPGNCMVAIVYRTS